MTRAIRAKLVFYVLIGVLATALVGFTVWVVTDQHQRLTELTERVGQKNAIIADKDDTISALTDDLVASQENATRLYEQILSLGATPDGEDPQTIAGPVGERGPRGDAGADATDAQVATALANYCSSFALACRGDPGQNGTNGVNGTNGAVGPEGPVGPVGPIGPVGPVGPEGPPGRGIASTYCDDTTGRWTVTYTDGVTADAGTCTTSPLEGVLP